MKLINRTKTYVNAAWLSLAVTLSQSASAALPTGSNTATNVAAPSGGANNNNVLDWIWGLLKDGATVGAVLLSIVCFIVAGGAVISSFKEASERKEWGGFVTTCLASAGAVMFCLFLVQQSLAA